MTSHNNNDQFLRRAFDAIYAFDPGDVKRGFRRVVNRRTRWLFITAFGCLLFLAVGVAVVNMVFDHIDEQNTPTLQERVAAPYQLTGTMQLAATALPKITGYTDKPLDPAELNPVLSCLIYADTCVVEAEEAAAEAGATGEAAEVEPALPPTAIAAVGAEYSQDIIDAQPPAVYVVVTQFENANDTWNALLEMYDYSRSVGSIGNYMISPNADVTYYYSSAQSRANFTWSTGSSIYWVSATTWTELETIIEALRLVAGTTMEGVSAS